MKSITKELVRELESAKEEFKTAFHVVEPTQIQVYGWLLNNFRDNIPYGFRWLTYNKRHALDKPLSETRLGSPDFHSKLYLSKTFREFSTEVGEATKLAGVTIGFIDVASDNWYKTNKPIKQEIGQKFGAELYDAYTTLRKVGYNRTDLTA